MARKLTKGEIDEIKKDMKDSGIPLHVIEKGKTKKVYGNSVATTIVSYIILDKSNDYKCKDAYGNIYTLQEIKQGHFKNIVKVKISISKDSKKKLGLMRLASTNIVIDNQLYTMFSSKQEVEFKTIMVEYIEVCSHE